MSPQTTRRRRSQPQGETITVSFVPVFGEVKNVRLPKDSTVEEALELAGYNASAVEVRHNGEGVLEMDMILEDGDELTVVSDQKIRNGRNA